MKLIILKVKIILGFLLWRNTMEKENLINKLKRNDNPMNLMALNYLLDYGRKNILNDDYYNYLIRQLENEYDRGKGNPFIQKDYAIEIIKTSRTMASIEDKDLYDFIQKDLIIINEVQQENNSPDYDY